jgi:hypothetical protein
MPVQACPSCQVIKHVKMLRFVVLADLESEINLRIIPRWKISN